LGGRSNLKELNELLPENIAAATEYSFDDAMWLLSINKQSYMAYRYLQGSLADNKRHPL